MLKKFLTATLVLALLIAYTAPIAAQGDITDDLAVYFSLDETSGTRSAQVGGMTLTDYNTVGAITGRVQYAPDAGGVAPNTRYLDTTSNATASPVVTYTFSVWIQANGVGSYLRNCRSGAACYAVVIEDWDGLHLNVDTWTGGDGTAARIAAPLSALDGAWHHLVAGPGFVYLDGGSVITGTDSTAVSTSVHFTIMQPVDEFALWTRALTADERAWLYNSGAGRSYSEVEGGLPPATFTPTPTNTPTPTPTATPTPVPPTPTLAPATMQTNLTAYWPLDELWGTRYDARGLYHLSEAGGIVAYDPAGIQSNGVMYAYAGRLESVSAAPFALNGDFTLSVWAHCRVTNAEAPEEEPCTSDSTLITSTAGYTLAFASGRIVLTYGATILQSGYIGQDWQHITIAGDSSWLSLRVNGGLVQSVARPAVLASPARLTLSGGNSVSLDEVGLWARKLSEAEQVWLWNQGAGHFYSDMAGALPPTPTPTPIAYFEPSAVDFAGQFEAYSSFWASAQQSPALPIPDFGAVDFNARGGWLWWARAIVATLNQNGLLFIIGAILLAAGVLQWAIGRLRSP